jgi:hypothetical protein
MSQFRADKISGVSVPDTGPKLEIEPDGSFNFDSDTLLVDSNDSKVKINGASDPNYNLTVSSATSNNLILPRWANDSLRPSNPESGTIGYNDSTKATEVFTGTEWVVFGGGPVPDPATYGLVSSNPATSARAILDINPSSPDGAYWIKPPGSPEAFLVHCYMTIEGGGWMLVLRNTSNELGNFASGSFLVSNWGGWTFNTKTQIDGLGFSSNNSTNSDTNCFTPIYAYSPFNDVMVIANRSGQQSKRIGWRHSTGLSNMFNAINTPDEKAASSVLFGEAFNWLRALDVRSDTNVMPAQTGTVKVGFKIRSDTGASLGTGNFVGGFHTTAMHYGSQIGCGRDNSNSNQWGGGFGGAYTTGPRFHRLSGHWWNHGDGRNGTVWNAQNDFSSPLFGHAVYVR